MTIHRATAHLQMTGAVGGLVILVGGVLMMTAVHGAFMHQVWFKVKMGVLVLLIVNMIVLGRPAGRRLLRMLYDSQGPVDHLTMSAARKRILLFYLLQLGLFLLIFVVSAYKFN